MPAFRLFVFVVFLGLVAAGCPADSGPSADYAAAARLWTGALQEKGDEAAVDPRAGQALELARTVPADSIDSEAAKALVRRIEEARREHAEREAFRAEPVRLVPAPDDDVGVTAETETSVADAGTPPPPSLPEVGSPDAAFKERYGACVAFDRPFLEARGSTQGEAWALVATAECREKHPELAGKHVFLLGGKVYNVAPLTAAVEVVQSADGTWQPATGNRPDPPDAGAPAPEAGLR